MIKNKNIDTDNLDNSPFSILTAIIDTQAVDATFGERALLEKYGLLPSPGNKSVDSHFYIENSDATFAVKFHTGGSQPYWVICAGDIDSLSIFPGFPDYLGKSDIVKFNDYLKNFEDMLKKLDFEEIEE